MTAINASFMAVWWTRQFLRYHFYYNLKHPHLISPIHTYVVTCLPCESAQLTDKSLQTYLICLHWYQCYLLTATHTGHNQLLALQVD